MLGGEFNVGHWMQPGFEKFLLELWLHSNQKSNDPPGLVSRSGRTPRTFDSQNQKYFLHQSKLGKPSESPQAKNIMGIRRTHGNNWQLLGLDMKFVALCFSLSLHILHGVTS